MSPGVPVDLTNCEREPIHIPGSIQPHGVLLTTVGPGKRILQVSAGSEHFVGRTAEELLGRTVEDVLDDASSAAVAAVMAEGAVSRVGVPLTVAPRRPGPFAQFEALLHRSDGVWVVELEPAPDGPQVGNTFHDVRDAVADLSRSAGTAELLRSAAMHVRRITGFDRVMLYRFDREWNGEVVAEDKAAELESFLGLHYPAGDIPPQARALYRVNWLRFIRDVDAVNVPLVPTLDPSTGKPLDLSLAALRSVSPIHCQYLRNMGVTASMSLSLLIEGELAGLIACHHYSGPFVPSAPVRATCEFLAQNVSLMLGARERDEQVSLSLATGRTLAEVVRSTRDAGQDLSGGLAPHAEALMRMVDADGISWTLDGAHHTAGVVPPAEDLELLRTWSLTRLTADGTMHTDRVGHLEPELAHLAGTASGVLLLHVAAGQDVLFVRSEKVHTIDWGGNPHLKELTTGDDGVARLSPRGSFALWRETVRMRSRPWEDAELEAAQGLRGHLVQLLFDRDRALAGVAETLQRSLLPEELPDAEGWTLAADYRPASVGVGGDWYDAVPVGGHRLLLVVGDVAGHGLEAAGAMAQLRNALRAYAVEDSEPVSVLTRLDRLVALLTPDAMATAGVVLLDTLTGEVSVATAGHPAPMTCRRSGTCELVPVETGPPLGAGHLGGVGERSAAGAVLHRGDSLLLVSDGLFERRDEAVDVSLELLATHAREIVCGAGSDPQAALNLLVDRARPSSSEDDATLLLAHRL